MRGSRLFISRSVVLLDHFDLGVNGVLLDRLDTVEAAGFRLVALGYRDDLAVLCLQSEAVLARLVGIHLKLRMLLGGIALDGLVLNICDGSVVLYRLNAVLRRLERIVNFGSSDNLAVACFKVKFETCFGFLDNEFSHFVSPFGYQMKLL